MKRNEREDEKKSADSTLCYFFCDTPPDTHEKKVFLYILVSLKLFLVNLSLFSSHLSERHGDDDFQKENST